MKHLTMQQLLDLGFYVIRSYIHGDFITQCRKKGIIIIETTWKKTGEFVSQKVQFTQDFQDLTPEKIIKLDEILNR